MGTSLRWCLPALVIAGIWAAGPAGAQDADFRRPDFGGRGVGEGDWVFVPRLKSVFQQPRPEYEPLGIRMGAWVLEPELQLNGAYNDNVFADDDDEESDVVGVIAPAFRLKSDTSVHMLGVEAGGAIARYADNSSEDTEEGRLTGFGRLDVTRDDTVFASAGIRRDSLGRTDPEDDEDEPTRLERQDARIGYIHRFARLNVRLDGRAQRFNFINGEDEDRDRDEYGITSRVTYALLSRFTPFLQGGVVYQDFGNPDENVGEERDATNYSASIGGRILLTDVMTGELAVGVFHSEFEEDAFDSVTSLGFSGSIAWNVTPLTSIIAGVERRGAPTSVAGASSRIETGGALRLEREVRRNLLVYGEAAYQNLDFQDIDRTDDRYNLGVGGEYLLNRNVSLTASYDLDVRESDASGEDFTRNVFLVGVRLQY